MTTIAHDLGINVVAEGVETTELFKQVRRLGLDSAQGFLVGRPMSADAFETLAESAPDHRFDLADEELITVSRRTPPT